MKATSSTQTRSFVGVAPFRTCDVTAYPLEQGGHYHDEAVRQYGTDQVIYRVGAGWTTAEMAAEMRAQHARRLAAAERAAALPRCAGCGAGLVSLDDERTPAAEVRWADDNRFDGPHNTAQDCDRTESGVHEPIVESVPA